MALTDEQKKEIRNDYGYRAASLIRAVEVCIDSGDLGRRSGADRMISMLRTTISGALGYLFDAGDLPENRIAALAEDLQAAVRDGTISDSNRAARCLHMAMNELIVSLDIPMPPEERLIPTIYENGNK